MGLHGERFRYRPALGSVQTEKGWQRFLVYFLLLPSMEDHFGAFFLIWGQAAEHFAVAMSPAVPAPLAAILLGCAFVPGRGRSNSRTPARENSSGAGGLGATLPGKGTCHHLAVHSASDGSCWPHCGFRLFNWSPVSTPPFPLTELGSAPGQNTSTPLQSASAEGFPVPEYGASESSV